MSTTATTRRVSNHRSREDPWPVRSALIVAVAWWVGGLLAAALIVAAIPPLGQAARDLLPLRLTPNPAGQVGDAYVHVALENLRLLAWYGLLAAAASVYGSRGRRVLTVALALSVLVNVAQVGAALGAYGIRLLPYLPQLPLEWLAMICGTAAVLLPLRGQGTRPRLIALFAAGAVLVLAAAAVEVLLTPTG